MLLECGPRFLPPWKLTAYLEHATIRQDACHCGWGWTNRLKVLHVGERDIFPGSNAFGEGRIDSYTITDFYSSLRRNHSEIRLGVSNLFNEFYFPVISQAFNLDSTLAAGQGASMTLTYATEW